MNDSWRNNIENRDWKMGRKKIQPDEERDREFLAFMIHRYFA